MNNSSSNLETDVSINDKENLISLNIRNALNILKSNPSDSLQILRFCHQELDKIPLHSHIFMKPLISQNDIYGQIPEEFMRNINENCNIFYELVTEFLFFTDENSYYILQELILCMASSLVYLNYHSSSLNVWIKICDLLIPRLEQYSRIKIIDIDFIKRLTKNWLMKTELDCNFHLNESRKFDPRYAIGLWIIFSLKLFSSEDFIQFSNLSFDIIHKYLLLPGYFLRNSSMHGFYLEYLMQSWRHFVLYSLQISNITHSKDVQTIIQNIIQVNADILEETNNKQTVGFVSQFLYLLIYNLEMNLNKESINKLNDSLLDLLQQTGGLILRYMSLESIDANEETLVYSDLLPISESDYSNIKSHIQNIKLPNDLARLTTLNFLYKSIPRLIKILQTPLEYEDKQFIDKFGKIMKPLYKIIFDIISKMEKIVDSSSSTLNSTPKKLDSYRNLIKAKIDDLDSFDDMVLNILIEINVIQENMKSEDCKLFFQQTYPLYESIFQQTRPILVRFTLQDMIRSWNWFMDHMSYQDMLDLGIDPGLLEKMKKNQANIKLPEKLENIQSKTSIPTGTKRKQSLSPDDEKDLQSKKPVPTGTKRKQPLSPDEEKDLQSKKPVPTGTKRKQPLSPDDEKSLKASPKKKRKISDSKKPTKQSKITSKLSEIKPDVVNKASNKSTTNKYKEKQISEIKGINSKTNDVAKKSENDEIKSNDSSEPINNETHETVDVEKLEPNSNISDEPKNFKTHETVDVEKLEPKSNISDEPKNFKTEQSDLNNLKSLESNPVESRNSFNEESKVQVQDIPKISDQDKTSETMEHIQTKSNEIPNIEIKESIEERNVDSKEANTEQNVSDSKELNLEKHESNISGIKDFKVLEIQNNQYSDKTNEPKNNEKSPVKSEEIDDQNKENENKSLFKSVLKKTDEVLPSQTSPIISAKPVFKKFPQNNWTTKTLSPLSSRSRKMVNMVINSKKDNTPRNNTLPMTPPNPTDKSLTTTSIIRSDDSQKKSGRVTFSSVNLCKEINKNASIMDDVSTTWYEKNRFNDSNSESNNSLLDQESMNIGDESMDTSTEGKTEIKSQIEVISPETQDTEISTKNTVDQIGIIPSKIQHTESTTKNMVDQIGAISPETQHTEISTKNTVDQIGIIPSKIQHTESTTTEMMDEDKIKSPNEIVSTEMNSIDALNEDLETLNRHVESVSTEVKPIDASDDETDDDFDSRPEIPWVISKRLTPEIKKDTSPIDSTTNNVHSQHANSNNETQKLQIPSPVITNIADDSYDDSSPPRTPPEQILSKSHSSTTEEYFEKECNENSKENDFMKDDGHFKHSYVKKKKILGEINSKEGSESESICFVESPGRARIVCSDRRISRNLENNFDIENVSPIKLSENKKKIDYETEDMLKMFKIMRNRCCAKKKVLTDTEKSQMRLELMNMLIELN